MVVSTRSVLFASVLAGVVVVGLAAACASPVDGEPTTDPTSPTPAVGRTQGSDPQASSSPTSSGAKCEELGSLVGTALTAKVPSPTMRSVTVPLADRPVPSRIGVIGVGSAAALVGKTVALGAGVDANYATCSHCFVIAVGCGVDCSSAAWFYPRSGSATFTQVPSAPGQKFDGTFTDVVLEEVTVDWKTALSTPVPNGACFHVPQFTFDATTGATASASGSSSSSSSSSGGADGGGGDAAVTVPGTSSASSASSSGTGTSGGTGHGGGGGDTTTKML